MNFFDEMLESSARAHGHLCAGQVIGVRMSFLGMSLLGFDLPLKLSDLKKLIVYVEMDRCAADAVAHTTGVKLGRRSLKYRDYGIMAATFFNMETKEAFRIISTEEARDMVDEYAPKHLPKGEKQLAAYKAMPDSILFSVQKVDLRLSDFDMPGHTRRKVICEECGQMVRDHKEVVVNGRVLCQPCAQGAYFKNPRPLTWDQEDLSRASANSRQKQLRQKPNFKIA
ncbi:FmdE family protein [Dethiosulfatarculus sandiegensis]|uniref:Formylmethanofuran dehydrogenase subunit E n=1 Tax=Dethiosulfatarculus sandiegensis TaxID=1429043 RepID=A0A0D2K2D7_9BACT|nr:FmdE family protein [Dethiosulfatarculus sandiegensis]KIX15820.1 formylmethanofuran dehydrogenase subunit E [Dethiosulfatarculus sandiegensis]